MQVWLLVIFMNHEVVAATSDKRGEVRCLKQRLIETTYATSKGNTTDASMTSPLISLHAWLSLGTMLFLAFAFVRSQVDHKQQGFSFLHEESWIFNHVNFELSTVNVLLVKNKKK